MSLALTTITNDLEDLIQAREEILAGEMCSACLGTATQFKPCATCNDTGQVIDSAALEQIELAIKQYSQELLPNKVDAYWWTLKKIGKKDDSKPLSQQTGMIADAKREIKRLQEMIDRLENLREFLSGCALQAISQRGGKPLDGSNGHRLRRQPNGGVQPVEVTQPELLPTPLQRVTVTMPLWSWKNAMEYVEETVGSSQTMQDMIDADAKAKPEPDKEAIREVLLKREPCPTCGGEGRTHLSEMAGDGPGQTIPCTQCGGEGTISSGLPGARLLDRGSHLRVS